MKHPLIAREGWFYLAVCVVVALLVTWPLGWWALPFWLAALFVLQFFRDPRRVPPQDAQAVLAPADGRVIVVERARDPYLEREALKISVFMNVFNVHSNRSPLRGEVSGRWYFPGGFVNAALDKASAENERNALALSTAHGDVTVVQIAGLIARRILCYVRTGDKLLAGQRYGFIRFGSRVDVYLPIAAQPQVSLGDRVKAGRDVIARFS